VLILKHLRLEDAAGMLMELCVDEDRLGVLAITNTEAGLYSEDQAHLLGLLNRPFATAVFNILRHQELQELRDRLADENRFLQGRFQLKTGSEIVGMQGGLRQVMGLARLAAPTDSPIMLTGETGTGKEIIADAIHHFSRRKNGPFVKVNCGAIPESLMDSELFGHEKGAFTGAVGMKPGRFERAHGGTIFLDEIGELCSEAQVRMLRVLQEKEIERVGGTEPIPVDIRVIAATNRDLGSMLSDGRFRRDLYFRINVFPLTIPPLRDRTADIPALVNHFIQKKSLELGLSVAPAPTRQAMDVLCAYAWPGNVRELENMVERALILNPRGPLTFEELECMLAQDPTRRPAREEAESYNLDQAMARHIRMVLDKACGRIEGVGGAAELLGLNPGTLRHRLRKLGIPFGRAAGRTP
jgi:transcriptional regulator with GAF, ATPase, and Fis domain